MATIQLINNCSSTALVVPYEFIDNYMPNANGEFVKVYLYLLRCIGSNSTNCSISSLADTFNHTEKDIIRALNYWERMNLISVEYNSNNEVSIIRFEPFNTINSNDAAVDNKVIASSGITPSPVATGTVSAKVNNDSVVDTVIEESEDRFKIRGVTSPALASEETITPAEPSVPEKREYTLDEVKNFRKNSDVSELFFIIETYLKHTLSTVEINTVLYWYGELGMSTDLIEYLVEYCISKGHSSIRYMEKVALSWKEYDIQTVEQAKENSALHSKTYYTVMKALGIAGRNLNDKEMAFVHKWTKEYKFDDVIIKEACERTITQIHQPSLEYAESILSKWFASNVHTLEDIKPLDTAYNKSKRTANNNSVQSNNYNNNNNKSTNKFNNFNQRQYDYDELEKVLLTTSIQ